MKCSWSLSIRNRPSFFGQRLNGESANDVHAHVRLKSNRDQSYPVYWDNQRREVRKTPEPGKTGSLRVFEWEKGGEGFYIADNTGDAVARFKGRHLHFVLVLWDRLERRTEISFSVEFDDTHLKNPPHFQFIYPVTLGQRVDRIRVLGRAFISVFTRR
jgi:hypothetical protein